MADNSAGRLVYDNSLYQDAVNHTGTATDLVIGTNCDQYVSGQALFEGNGDYNLCTGSVAIDRTGITTTTGNPTEDLQHDPRPYGTSTDPVYDYGAYEAFMAPEGKSMIVDTYDDVVNPWDFKISLREALTVYYGSTTGGTDGKTVTFAATLESVNTEARNPQTTDIHMNVNDTFTLDSTHNGLVIEGANRIVFDGKAFGDYHTAFTFNSRLFYLSEAADVTFNDLKFQNIESSARGGFIAAIVADSATPKKLTVNRSTFDSNKSTDGAGAIRVTNMNLVLNDSTFNKNEGTRGGAVYAVNVHGGVTVTGGAFTENTAQYGGAMALRTETSPISIGGTAFSSNTATVSEGGALYIALAGETVNIGAGTSFADNKATAATGKGGAIYFATLATGTASTVNITGTESSHVTFSGNEAAGDGGAVYGDVTGISYADFTSNKSTGGNGGAITGNVGTVTSSVFDQNSATNGGAVYTNGMTAVDTVFKSNTAVDRGGAVISGDAGALLSFTGGSFESNTAGTRGGAIWGYRITADGTEFKTNKATGEEGGAILARADVTLTGVTATGNTAAKSGGFLYEMDNTAAVTIGGASSFSTNNAGLHGGAVYAGNVQITGTADDPEQGTTGVPVTFTGNTAAGGNGGALYLTEGAGNTISKARFVGNTAGATGSGSEPSGGAIYLTGTASQLNLTDSYFEGNTAGTQFTSDSSGVRGFGGALRNNGGTVTIDNCEFTLNKASRGCAVQSAQGTMTVTNSKFSKNTGLRGGGIIMKGGTLNVSNSEFSENEVQFGGGVLGDTAVLVKIDNNCKFTDNTATSFGGAVYDNKTKIEISDSVFTGNKSAQGGAINFYEDYATITNCTISGNTATGRGGAIFVRNSSSVDVINCVITGNEATGTASVENSGRGAAICSNGKTSVYQSLIAGNKAAVAGGGIYHEGSYSLEVNWSTLYGNTADSAADGTDLYVSSTYSPNVNASIVGSAHNTRSYYYYGTLFTDCVIQNVTGGYSDTHCDSFSDPSEVFADAAGGNYRLVSGSPAIDWVPAGTAVDPPAKDLDGVDRTQGGPYDAGAYEFVPSPAELPYSDTADAAFASLGDDDLAVDFDTF